MREDREEIDISHEGKPHVFICQFHVICTCIDFRDNYFRLRYID